MEIFFTRDAAKKLGLKYYQLQYLLNAGKVKDVSRTSANHRLFTQKDIDRISEFLANDKKGTKGSAGGRD